MRLRLQIETLRSMSPMRLCVLGSLAYAVLYGGATLLAQLTGIVMPWLATYGLAGLYLIGLCWSVYGVEMFSQRRRLDRLANPPPPGRRITNPLDAEAWYYGREGRKLKQSIALLVAYTLAFFLLVALIAWLWLSRDIYELPAGGGEAKALAQTVQVQKIIRTKYVVNPYSAIRFEVPPIDDVKLRLDEATEHAYQVGYGQGTGTPGFGAGTARGKVRFIRLRYEGGNWDQKFGIGADLNMLLEYGIRTGQKVADKTESKSIAELRGFPKLKSPPLVYLTGERNIVLTRGEIRALREYLLDRHGMIFGDNGGSMNFHRQFVSMMAAVLPEVRPVAVPLDDMIHRVPYPIPFLPYVAPHGGKVALGWWVEGRWVCYYHPGDVGDAWCDGHAGVKSEIWELCYQLGTNVIFYAHAEYAKWLESQKVHQ